MARVMVDALGGIKLYELGSCFWSLWAVKRDGKGGVGWGGMGMVLWRLSWSKGGELTESWSPGRRF